MAEYAAGLVGINVDCTELLRAGETGRRKQSAASRVLAILKKRWDGKTFTTRDLVKELAKVNSMIEDGKERAAELADALCTRHRMPKPCLIQNSFSPRLARANPY
jgi:hypothetical protein